MILQDSEKQHSNYYIYYYDPSTDQLTYQKDIKISADLKKLVPKNDPTINTNPPLHQMVVENAMVVRVTTHENKKQRFKRKDTEFFKGN